MAIFGGCGHSWCAPSRIGQSLCAAIQWVGRSIDIQTSNFPASSPKFLIQTWVNDKSSFPHLTINFVRSEYILINFVFFITIINVSQMSRRYVNFIIVERIFLIRLSSLGKILALRHGRYRHIQKAVRFSKSCESRAPTKIEKLGLFALRSHHQCNETPCRLFLTNYTL